MKSVSLRMTCMYIFLLVLASVSLSSPLHAADGEVLTLREAVLIAIKNNPDIGIAQQGLTMAEKNLQGDFGQLLPDFRLNFSGGHAYYGPSSVEFDPQGRPVQKEGFDYSSYYMQMSSGITLFNGGRNIYSIKSSRRYRDAAREDLRYSKDIVTANVIRAYYNLVRTKMLKVVQEESVEQAQRNLERSEALLEVGSATRADVLKARVSYSNSKLSLIKAKNAVDLAAEELINVLNAPDASIVGRVDTSLVIEILEPKIEDEIRYALANRSDLKSLGFNLEARQSDVTVAKSGWWPTIGAQFNYNWSSRDIAEGWNFFKEEYYWSIGAGLQWNVFDRFVTSTSVGTARANLRIAEHNLEKAKLDAETEITQIVLIIYETIETMKVAAETVEQADEDLRLAEERYRVGAGTMLDILTAQVTFTQARADVIDAKCNYLIAVADLSRATGGIAYEEGIVRR